MEARNRWVLLGPRLRLQLAAMYAIRRPESVMRTYAASALSFSHAPGGCSTAGDSTDVRAGHETTSRAYACGFDRSAPPTHRAESVTGMVARAPAANRQQQHPHLPRAPRSLLCVPIRASAMRRTTSDLTLFLSQRGSSCHTHLADRKQALPPHADAILRDTDILLVGSSAAESTLNRRQPCSLRLHPSQSPHRSRGARDWHDTIG